MSCRSCGAGSEPGTAAIIYPGGRCRGCVCEDPDDTGEVTCPKCHKTAWEDIPGGRHCTACGFMFSTPRRKETL